MNNYDKIEVVEKGVDEIVEVEKFNPFHDARGRFSNKNGFASYSANPNTKAGAMAIARSAAAGHGKTLNVHSQSYGENIRQNANWIGRGQNNGSRFGADTALRNRIERTAGLGGASAAGASWQSQNQQQGRVTKPSKQPAQQPQQQAQQQPQKPAPTKQTQTQQAQQSAQQQNQQQQSSTYSLDAATQGVYLGAGDKLAIQPRDYSKRATTTRNVAKANDQERVVGKDISDTVDISTVKGRKDPIDKMAELQGWNKGATVTDDLETFQKAAKKSGCVLMRSVSGNSGTGESADAICVKTMTDGNAALGGTGAQWYGSGLYTVHTTFGNNTGKNLTKRIAEGQQHSYGYGNTQMMATLHPDAKIATPTQAAKLKTDFYSMSSAKQKKYGDYGAYIASKGYDGAQWHSSASATAYTTVYNKTAMIFYSGVADRY